MKIFKNRNLRKTITLGIILIILSTLIFAIVNNIQYKHYLKIVNEKIDNIINKVIEKYPSINTQYFFDILFTDILSDSKCEEIMQKFKEQWNQPINQPII